MAENILLVIEGREMWPLPQEPLVIREERAENCPLPLGQRKALICSKAGGWIK